MAMTVSVQLDGSSATYEVKHEIDGVYKATLLSNAFLISLHFPKKIILIRSNEGWTSDCPMKAIGLKIGQKISEHEGSSILPNIKAEVNLLNSEQPITTVVPCTILIIDDDEDDVAILSEAFTQCGVDGVHYVFSGMKAFMYLQGVEPDCLPKLIITDHFLPGMTGAEFLKDLKGMEKYKHIHVVVLSTTKSEKEIEKYREMGALDYLIKPTSYDDYVRVAADMKSRAGL
ncbi:response regulator [Aridibaculum aurantiacum]|uniref:response regulator n=1 Tax=Aridibaculum aurantiacum TaxID=2810307 RepID=UPI001F614875|nr:response regulator [Aridibaculum aurantiacum]